MLLLFGDCEHSVHTWALHPSEVQVLKIAGDLDLLPIAVKVHMDCCGNISL